jgi:Holliday junction resolvasome RuvABC endonuclease subunit
MAIIRVAGLDGSKTNFGIAIMSFDTDNPKATLKIEDLILAKTEKSKEKKVRASSDNLARSQLIVETVHPAIKDCIAAFIEVPSGGQSYDAVLGFGIVIGIYASLPVRTIEVSPSETKIAAVGTRTASKAEMIEWALTRFPDAPWRLRKLKGVMVPTNDNEHLADAAAIVLAGIETPSFKNTLTLLRSMSLAA